MPRQDSHTNAFDAGERWLSVPCTFRRLFPERPLAAHELTVQVACPLFNTEMHLFPMCTTANTMRVEGSREIPEDVAYAKTVQYLILRMSSKGLSGVAPGRSR